MSGGLKRILLWLLASTVAALGCARGAAPDGRARTPTLAEALQPAFFAAAVGRAGGAHWHGTARFAAGTSAPDDGVTTTTDVWVDRARNFRLSETNDRDGGREIVRAGRDLFVALRYGKMIRRVAEEPEPGKLLEEGLGAPWAAWEIAAPYAKVDRSSAAPPGATSYALARAAARTDDPAARATDKGLRAWRADVVVDTLSGRATVDDGTGALLAFELTATFTTKRDGRALTGAVEVHGGLENVGATASVAAPAAEELAARPRLVPEQRELLAGLPTTKPAPPAAPKPGARPAAAASAQPSHGVKGP